MEIDHFKANIEMLAKQYDMSLAEVARFAGYANRQEFNNLFYRGYSDYDVKQIAEVFGVDKQQLLEEVEPYAFAARMVDQKDRLKENLKMILAEHKMTLSQFAVELGYTKQTFWKVFRPTLPRPDIVEKICAYLDIDEEELTDQVDFDRWGSAFIPRQKS